MREKIPYLNYMRAVATIAVVLMHVASNNWYGYIGTFDWNVFTFYICLTRFSVPVFVMISGALFLQKDKVLDIKKIYTHNIFRMLVFLLFWSMVYQMWSLITFNKNFKFSYIYEAIRALLKGETQVHLWFVYMIIGIYIIVPIIKTFTDYASKRKIEYFLGIYFIFNCLLPFFQNVNNKYVNVFTINFSKLGIAYVSYIGYFVLGIYLNRYGLENVKQIIIYLGGACSFVFTVVMTYIKSVSADACNEFYLGYTMPGVFLMSMSIFVFMKKYNDNERKGLYKLLDIVADNSLGIYGVHMLFVFILWKIGIDTFLLPGVISVPIITFIVLVFSIVAVKLIKLVPILGKRVV